MARQRNSAPPAPPAPVVIDTPSNEPAAPETYNDPLTAPTGPTPVIDPLTAPMGVKFRISPLGRPTSGARLFAHTAAFLTASGMFTGAARPRSEVKAVIDETAFGYHRKLGNIEETPAGTILTEQGKAFFAAREKVGSRQYVSPELKAAFLAALTEGKHDGDRLGFKNPAALVKIA